MKKVMEYKFKDVHIENITLPAGAVVLGVAAVYGVPAVFALIDVDEKEEEVRTFRRVRTGLTVPDSIADCKYLGTYLVESFGTTWSVFEEVKGPTVGLCGSGPAQAKKVTVEELVPSTETGKVSDLLGLETKLE